MSFDFLFVYNINYEYINSKLTLKLIFLNYDQTENWYHIGFNTINK